jgi:hypothetical protein
MTTFSENLLISLIGEKLAAEPSQVFDVRHGIEAAMEGTSDEQARLERLAAVLETSALPEATAVINLWKTPVEELWVRAEVGRVQKELTGLPRARLIITGLWHNLAPDGKRTAATQRQFAYWQLFIEGRLVQNPWANLEIIWVG